jgi:hypothetical protein
VSRSNYCDLSFLTGLAVILGVRFAVSKQSLAQSPTIFGPVLREQISRSISSMVDNMALFGTGPQSGQALGVFAGCGSPAKLSSGMTWPNYQNYRTRILQTDLQPDSLLGWRWHSWRWHFIKGRRSFADFRQYLARVRLAARWITALTASMITLSILATYATPSPTLVQRRCECAF